MYQIVVLLVTFLVAVKSRTVGTQNSIFTAQDRYIVSTDAKNWYQAFINCKIAGSELVSIESAVQQANLQSYLTKNNYTGTFWTGGTNLADENNWYWATTGRPIIYTNWNAGQPDNENDNERCLQWRDDNKWNDAICKRNLKYICEFGSFSD